MSATATTATRRSPRARSTGRTAVRESRPRVHEPDDLQELSALLAAPIVDADRRARFDRALGVLLGPDGADAPHLQPSRHTTDVVRQRIAGRALARIDAAAVPHRHLVSAALAILRA